MADIEHAFNQFLSIRMDYIDKSILSQSDEYKHLIGDCNRIFLDLLTKLPEDCKDTLQNYDTATTLLQGIAEVLMYKQGLHDGISLNRLSADT
ncbi:MULTISPECIES: hypothetical protein [unclassified Paenibacillus]|uniref:hypothetical protein n=1 Tax=unclassified Paenibacillus TaxID=185978 RepID=UPI0004F6BC8C|nr:hypothetical protein [Paenibacillus sp. FSL H7-0357]AIQ16360.1 hypothetical protein H70357_06470 [Paenibacillus sp. FSL H7-0357]